MKVRAAVALGLAVKIPVLDVHAHGDPHVGPGGQLLAERQFFRRPAKWKTVVFLPATISAHSSISTVRPSPAFAKNFQTAGGPAWNDTKFLKSSGERKPSALTQTRMRLAKTCRSTGTVEFRFAPSAQSYLEFTRPKSTHNRAMPPMPLVSKTKEPGRWKLGNGSWKRGFRREKTDGCRNRLRNGGVAFQGQRRFAGRPARREARDVDVSSRNGLNVNRA